VRALEDKSYLLNKINSKEKIIYIVGNSARRGIINSNFYISSYFL